jgi:hypothetical protein
VQSNESPDLCLDLKAFQFAKSVIAGIELVHMIRKGQLMRMAAARCLLPIDFMPCNINPHSSRIGG